MIKNDMTFKIAGEAGQGVESTGAGFTKAFARLGLYIFGLQDYMSRIRGGLNFFQVRVKDEEIFGHTSSIHLLIPLTQEALNTYKYEVVQGGGILFDESLKVNEVELKAKGIKLFPFPLNKIALEIGGFKIMANTAAIGAAAGLTESGLDGITSVITDNFRRKGSAVVDTNLKVANAAYTYAVEHYAKGFEYKIEKLPSPKRMVLNGNQALCMGALVSGCKFVSAYPMTPASTIIEWMSARASKYGLVTKQTEDELAAILMAIGASHAGVRAMTATSGGGFCLMVEALGLAGCTETPLVVVEAQRPGPSTGLPTRTEQGDLLFIINASHGEFPKIVLTPGTIEECFDIGFRAFNLADRFQCPVIIITDQNLASSFRSIDIDRFNTSKLKIDRGSLLTQEELDRLNEPYLRHKFTESGISPRAIPGHPKAVFQTTSDEHSEDGQIIEDSKTRIKMMQKRMNKLILARQELKPPKIYGNANAEVTFIGWGSTYGAIKEATDHLNKNGVTANFVHLTDVWPFPAEKLAALLEQSNYTICVENNYSGQMARLITAHTGKVVDQKILKYDGRPFSSEEILSQVRVEVIHK